MTRNERLRWIARHLVSVGVRYDGHLPEGRGVEPAEVSLALHELVDLREEVERQRVPRVAAAAALRRWFGGRT